MTDNTEVTQAATQEQDNFQPIRQAVPEVSLPDVHDDSDEKDEDPSKDDPPQVNLLRRGRSKDKNHQAKVEDLDKLECVKCNMMFTRRSTFRHHIKLSHGESGHACAECKVVLPSPQALRVHLATHTRRGRLKPMVFQPELLQEGVGGEGERVKPKGKKRGRPKKKEPVEVDCDIAMGDKSVKMEDLTTKEKPEEEKPMETNITLEDNGVCLQVQEDVQVESENIETHNIEERVIVRKPKTRSKRGFPKDLHQCGVCMKAFALSGTLQRHMRTHSDEKPFICDQCPAAFKWPQALLTHKRTHTGVKPYACPECPKTFRQIGTMKSHLRSHRGEKNYQCDICQATFTRAMRLRIHMRVHTGERPYHCDQCGEGFADPQIYKKHVRLHTGEKPYKCHDCGAAFVMARYLTEHRKIHTGERRYLCAICGMAFANSGRLKRHSVIHTGVKPYECGDCGRMFAHNGDLKVHQRIHTGEKPHLCPICGKAFTQHSGMAQHLAIHSSEKKYACMTCDAHFNTRGKLKRHSLIHPRGQFVAVTTYDHIGIHSDTHSKQVSEACMELAQENDSRPLVSDIVEELTKEDDRIGQHQETSVIIEDMQPLQHTQDMTSSDMIPNFVNVLQTATTGEEYHVQTVLPPGGNVLFQGQPGEIQTLTLNFENGSVFPP